MSGFSTEKISIAISLNTGLSLFSHKFGIMATIEIKDYIENKEEYERFIKKYFNPPECHMHILLNRYLTNKQAVFAVKNLIKYDRYSHELIDIANSVDQGDCKWDCYIAISREWYDKRNTYPAYFAYLMGHELGHAKIYFSERLLHIHCCLIENYIKCASDGKINCYHQCPHEILCDTFGKYFSTRLYDENTLLQELEEIKSQTCDTDERVRLESIQKCEPTDIFEGLKGDLIRFSTPYKNELIKCWKENVEKNGTLALASVIPDHDFEKLFELY